MSLDIKKLIEQESGNNYLLHAEHINPRFVKTLKTIGFDNCYTKAEGQYLWDNDDNRYLDMLAGYGVFNLGRNNPDIRQALVDFMQADYPSLVQMEAPLLSGVLARELKQRIPYELEKVYLTNSGTEGVESAIKFARCATNKPGIIYLKKAYHGLSNGSLSINGDQIFREGFGPLLNNCYVVPMGDSQMIEDLLKQHDIAAIIVEPVQGKGVNIPPQGFLKTAQDLCRQHKALFIADEIQCGMGRTGKFLAIEHEEGVEPDIVILSKALSGGYVPVGAVLCKEWIYNKVFSSMNRSVVHSSTFGQGSLAMVAGLATLQLMDELNILANAKAMGDKLGQGLTKMQAEFEFMHEIRWRGLMVGIEFGPPRSMSLKAAWSLAHKLDKSLFPQAVTIPLLQDHKILTQVAGHQIDVIKLIPPLIITDEDVDDFLTAFRQVMQAMHKFPGPSWEVISRVSKSAFSGKKSLEKENT